MKTISCEVVSDLLPMYAEKLLSSTSIGLVEEHLRGCPACQAKLKELQAPLPCPQGQEEAAPLVKIQKRLRRQRCGTAAVAGLLVAAVLVLAFVHLTAPIPVHYDETLVQVEALPDGTVIAVLDSRAAGWEAFQGENLEGGRACHLTVWDNLWNQYFGNGQPRAAVLSGPQEGGINPLETVYFYSIDLDEVQPGRVIWGSHAEQNDHWNGGVYALPRLALGYYVFLMGLALLVCAALSMTARRGTARRRWAARAALVPLAYLAAHLCTKGVALSTYTMVKDLSGILLAALPLFGLLWRAQTLLWHRAEKRQGAPLQ